MPHTRAARLRALHAARERSDIQQIPSNVTNVEWNDYQSWDFPGSTYQHDTLGCFPSEKTGINQARISRHTQNPISVTSSSPDSFYRPFTTTDSPGWHSWHSISLHDMPLVTSATISPFSQSGNEYHSYDFTSPGDNSQVVCQGGYDSEPWQSNIIYQTSSVSDELCSQKRLEEPAVNLNKNLDRGINLAPKFQSERVRNATSDASKKRKAAHSVIEQRYRSRILEGLAELRHCVPSAAKIRSDCDSKHPKENRAVEDAKLNHSTGKLATISDAVQYVRALELQIKALHMQLEVTQRRNYTLQNIASRRMNGT